MFLVGHSLEIRAREVRAWLVKHPSVALLVSAAYFEWTICRGILALSRRPNAEVRQILRSIYGLEKYKDLWRDELAHLPDAKRLPEVVADWCGVREAFEGRNRLVHGRDRYTRRMATPGVESLLTAVSDVVEYCASQGVDINKRLPVRRGHRSAR
jgi:hypothetical protein